MSRTRISLIFNGAKFDYELDVSADEVVESFKKATEENIIVTFTDTSGMFVEVSPKQIPLVQIEPLGGNSDE